MIEEKISELTKRKYVVPVRSGTDALYLSLVASGIQKGDKVLVSNFSWISTASCITMVGATPVFCDIDLNTYHMCLQSIRRMVSPDTKALIFPHLFGSMMETDQLVDFCKERKIILIEDACQAVGSSLNGVPAGSIGDISTFSFNLNKVVSGITGGGAVLTDNEKYAQYLHKISHHGYNGIDFEFLGINAKMSEIDKDAICKQLGFLEKTNQKRNNLAKNYDNFFASLPVKLQKTPKGICNNHHKYTVRFNTKEVRDKVQKILNCKIHYPMPISENTMYRDIVHQKDKCVNAKLVSDTILTLPMDSNSLPVDDIYKLLVEKIITQPDYAMEDINQYTKDNLHNALYDIARSQ